MEGNFINVFVPFYDAKNELRERELFECLKKNADLSEIDKIYLVLEDPEHSDKRMEISEKVIIIRPKTKARQTFASMFELVNVYEHEHQMKNGERFQMISIVCNSDIYFNESLKHLKTGRWNEKTCFALTRWDDINGNYVLFDRKDSMDAWIFFGPIKKIGFADFYFGFWNCDTRIGEELEKAGYIVKNPCKSIMAVHLHSSNVRTYESTTDCVPYTWPPFFCAHTEIFNRSNYEKQMFNSYNQICNNIEGWYLYDIVNPVLETIAKIQRQKKVSGPVCEIGVHHGKSFIPLAILCDSELEEFALAVDCFESQDANVDLSGRGVESKLLQNCETVLGTKTSQIVKTMKADSTKLKKEDFPSTQFRVFSIDGSHTVAATLADLKNAADVTNKEYGIIILDDYGNADWPGVQFAVDSYLRDDSEWKPVFLGGNKIILAHRTNLAEIRLALAKHTGNTLTRFLPRYFLAGVWYADRN